MIYNQLKPLLLVRGNNSLEDWEAAEILHQVRLHEQQMHFQMAHAHRQMQEANLFFTNFTLSAHLNCFKSVHLRLFTMPIVTSSFHFHNYKCRRQFFHLFCPIHHQLHFRHSRSTHRTKIADRISNKYAVKRKNQCCFEMLCKIITIK